MRRHDKESGTTLRAPSETGYSKLTRTDVIIATNHRQKRVTPPPATEDSVQRYDEIWRRIQAALDAKHKENPTKDAVIDVVDARWIMSGVSGNNTLLFFVFEPNTLKVHVAFQQKVNVGAVNVTPVALTWKQLFPAGH